METVDSPCPPFFLLPATDLPLTLRHGARVSSHCPARASAVRPPPGTRKVPGGKLAVRGRHRDLHPAAANPRRLAARRDARADHHVALADAVRDAARRAVAGA